MRSPWGTARCTSTRGFSRPSGAGAARVRRGWRALAGRRIGRVSDRRCPQASAARGAAGHPLSGRGREESPAQCVPRGERRAVPLLAASLDRVEQGQHEFDAGGALWRDGELGAYLTGVARKLQPPAVLQVIPFRVAVVKNPRLNAFPVGNGALYLYSRLLSTEWSRGSTSSTRVARSGGTANWARI